MKHGTVTALIDGEPLEITTFRVDGTYSDHRRPEEVTFTRSLREDVARRDFTVNAMAYNPYTGLVDPWGGREDLCGRALRAVGDPEKRFSEDALRIMRALRFSSTLGFSIEEETKKAILKLYPLLLYKQGDHEPQEIVGKRSKKCPYERPYQHSQKDKSKPRRTLR